MSAVDRDAPLRFLRTAFHPDDWVAVFLKPYETGLVAQRVGSLSWVMHPRFQAWLRFKNAHRYNVYVSVNAIQPGRRSRTREAIGAIRHVFLEADHDGPAVLTKIASRPDLPEPSYVLRSSPNRVHVFWRVEGFDVAHVEALQKQLARELGTDVAATASTQTTRLPGFNYLKSPVVRTQCATLCLQRILYAAVTDSRRDEAVGPADIVLLLSWRQFLWPNEGRITQRHRLR